MLAGRRGDKVFSSVSSDSTGYSDGLFSKDRFVLPRAVWQMMCYCNV
jgi:hypothetical protein